MRVLIMGGDRHDEWIELMDGSPTYVDLRTADTYPIRAINWAITGTDGHAGRFWRVMIAVHPSLTRLPPQMEQEQVQGALFRMTMTHWMETFGTEQPMSDPVPNSPASLFDAAGRPLPASVHEPAAGDE
jgi:hypothetical protein